VLSSGQRALVSASPEPAPRRGSLQIRLAERRGKTVVVDQYASSPFKLFTSPASTGHAVVLQVSMLGPGIVSGDALDIHITAESGASAVVLFTSATKVLGAVDGLAAEQRVRIDVADDAQLEYYPGLVIPYPRARFRQRADVRLASGARFGLLDLWSTGRIALGEELAFDELDGRTRVTVDDVDAYRDAVALVPEAHDLTGAGLLEGYRYVASGYWHWPGAQPTEPANIATDDVQLVTGKPGTGERYLRALAKDGLALRRELAPVLAETRAAWGLAPIDFARYTTMLD
jgi:urease accessory protein